MGVSFRVGRSVRPKKGGGCGDAWSQSRDPESSIYNAECYWIPASAGMTCGVENTPIPSYRRKPVSSGANPLSDGKRFDQPPKLINKRTVRDVLVEPTTSLKSVESSGCIVIPD